MAFWKKNLGDAVDDFSTGFMAASSDRFSA